MTEGQKTFVNQTGKDISITIFVRAGDAPEDDGGIALATVGRQGTVSKIYQGEAGELGYVYLNGLLIEWHEGPNLVGVSRKVVEGGDDWDRMLNNNEIIYISAVASGTFNASGTNNH